LFPMDAEKDGSPRLITRVLLAGHATNENINLQSKTSDSSLSAASAGERWSGDETGMRSLSV
jgi:hypothetical protein